MWHNSYFDLFWGLLLTFILFSIKAMIVFTMPWWFVCVPLILGTLITLAVKQK